MRKAYAIPPRRMKRCWRGGNTGKVGGPEREFLVVIWFCFCLMLSSDFACLFVVFFLFFFSFWS